MTPSPCIQTAELATIKTTLQLTTEKFMEFFEKIDNRMDKTEKLNEERHFQIMEKFDGLDTKYAKKESVSRLWNMFWAISGFFATTVGAYLLSKLLK